MEMVEVGWLSILPPVIAIVLALLTKEAVSYTHLDVYKRQVKYIDPREE